MSDYCGRTEFALMHHHHHDRNARDFMAPSVYLILVNLMAGSEHAVEEVRWWRRYIRSLMPRGAMPPIALIGARADRVAKPNHLMSAIRDQANADGRELPEVSAHFAFDCRGAAWPLRDWYVAQHDQLVGAATPIPKVVDAFLVRKQEWSEKHRHLRALPWGEFCARLRRELREVGPAADEHAIRALAGYLHDMSAILYVEPPEGSSAEAAVVLDVPWFFSSIAIDLLEALQRPGAMARRRRRWRRVWAAAAAAAAAAAGRRARRRRRWRPPRIAMARRAVRARASPSPRTARRPGHPWG